ncbi:MAG: DUF2079 domain-containing protein [Myxococcales bacterium]|nr:DUF2079 domain-containing protein [Myxococcales bacterium]
MATLSVTAALFALAHARLEAIHHRTFDLAFYSRMAWGLARGDFWDPFLEAHVLGLHVSPVLLPIGLLGALVGTPVALLLAQSAACAAAAHVLGRLAARRLGTPYHWLGFAALLAHPNLVHVAAYEAHPGTLALFPLALAVERLDAGHARGFVLACVGALCCREDLALVTALLGVLAVRAPALRWAGVGVALGSLAYLAVFVLVLHPRFAPSPGSFELHFGAWGASPGEVVARWLRDPGAVLAYLAEPRQATYLIRVTAPFAVVLPLLGARWLLPALPILTINLLSAFPSTTNLDSHYLTPALPFLVAATLCGLARLRPAARPRLALALALVLALSYALDGQRPTDPAFHADERTAAGRVILDALAASPDRSVQAPDPLLPHLAERARVHRAPPPDRGADLVVLDVSHRQRYARREDLLRTVEEPRVRDWLARDTYGPIAAAGPYLALQRGADPRRFLDHHRDDEPPPTPAVRLTECLSITGARLIPTGVALELRAHGPCPHDLAIRVGPGERSRRVDLLFEGLVSPAHLRDGDRVLSKHTFRPGLLDAEVWVGLLRSSGARPAPGDPVRVAIPLRGGPTR